MDGIVPWVRAATAGIAAAPTLLKDIVRRSLDRAAVKLRGRGAQAREAWFATVIDNQSQGLVVFDKDRKVVICNKRYREIYGLTAEQVAPGTPTSQLIKRRLELGLKIPDNPADYVRERTSGDVKASKAIQEFADGRIIAYAVRPMPDGGGIATHDDITDREQLHAEIENQHLLVRQQQQELSLRNLQFDAALNNMSQGLCFFDGLQRLIVCNRRYTEMYGLDPDRVRPGLSLIHI